MARIDWGEIYNEYAALVAQKPDITLKVFCADRELSYDAARKQFSRRKPTDKPAVSKATLRKSVRKWEHVQTRASDTGSMLYPGTLEALIESGFVPKGDADVLRRTAQVAHDVYIETENQRRALLEEIENPLPPPKEGEPPRPSPQDRLFSLLLNASTKISSLEASLIGQWRELEKHRLTLRQQSQRDAEEARKAADYTHKLQARGLVTEGLQLKQENEWSYTQLAEWLTAKGVWDLPDFITLQVRAELESDDFGDENVTYSPMSDDEIKARAEATAAQLAHETALATEKTLLVNAAVDEHIQDSADNLGDSGAAGRDECDEWDDHIDFEAEEKALEASIRQQSSGGAD